VSKPSDRSPRNSLRLPKSDDNDKCTDVAGVDLGGRCMREVSPEVLGLGGLQREAPATMLRGRSSDY
jgi:hypothetical protein